MAEVTNHRNQSDPESQTPADGATERERDAAAMAWLSWHHRQQQAGLVKRQFSNGAGNVRGSQ